MEKLKVLLMFFVVLIGLAGAFAFKTPTHKKSKFTSTSFGIKNFTIPCSTNPNTTTITIPVANVADVTGLTLGVDYRCPAPLPPICVINLPAGLPAATGGNYVITRGTYAIVTCGTFHQP